MDGVEVDRVRKAADADKYEQILHPEVLSARIQTRRPSTLKDVALELWGTKKEPIVLTSGDEILSWSHWDR